MIINHQTSHFYTFNGILSFSTYISKLNLCQVAISSLNPFLVFLCSVELALHAVFGEHVTIQYCFYHLTQSIWRKIQSLGLTNLYESDDDFRLFCGQIDALAFLPLHEVSEGMTYLRESAPEESTPLLEYFDTNYVTGHLRPRPQIFS